MPFSSVTVLNSTPVASFLRLMLAPGMTPPDVSATVPESDEVFAPCPKATVPIVIISAVNVRVQTERLSLSIIQYSLRKGLQRNRVCRSYAESVRGSTRKRRLCRSRDQD